MKQRLQTLKDKYRNLKRWEQLTLALLIIAILALIYTNINKKEESLFTSDENIKKEVIVKSVSDLSLDKEPLSLIGSVQSESQVEIRTESTGSITNVSVELGQKISAGQQIAQIENSTQRATVNQARSLVDAQQAQLDNLEDSFSENGNTVAIENAYRTLLSTGLVAEPEKNSTTVTPPIISGFYSGQEQGVYDLRIMRGEQSGDYEFFLKGLENIKETEIINSTLISTPLGTRGLKISFPEDIDNYLETTWLIKIPNTESSSYTANLNAYNSALDAGSGVSDQTVAQRAQVRSAQSNLDAAIAQLEKTIIRSPIAGTVTNLSLDIGDFVSTFQSVAIVANENQLEIKTFITEADKKGLEVGLPATVSGKFNGVITSISPAIDPATKKIEVDISVEEDVELLNGQSVSVSIDRKFDSTETIEQIFIPLSALKVTAEGVVVFTVDESGIIQKKLVKEGPLVGNKVLILEGLTPEMKIVTDVRGISAGDEVTITN